jgi:hypothetical protein
MTRPPFSFRRLLERVGEVRTALVAAAGLLLAGAGAWAMVPTRGDLEAMQARTSADLASVRADARALERQVIEQARDLKWIAAQLEAIQQATGARAVPKPQP